MRVNVVTSRRVVSKFTGKPGGNTYGYFTGAGLFQRALETVGVERDPNARIQIHYTAPHFYNYKKGKINVLFSMWETENVPEELWDAFLEADWIIVPSLNSWTAVKKMGTQVPVSICQHGIDTEFFTFQGRVYNAEPFRFLWVGAPNIRKGYDLVVKSFYWAFCKLGLPAQLYIKASLYRKEGKMHHLPQFKTIIDTRNISMEDLRRLYQSANVFLFPSRGEGAGLPPLEAMSTGLPVIAPRWSGMADYMLDEHSYPVRYTLREADYGVPTTVAEPDMTDLISRLNHIYYNKEEAAEKGKKASIFVGKKFSLQAMGERMLKILRRIGE